MIMAVSKNKTPRNKRSARNILCAISPGRGVRSPGAVVFVNDDEEERRQRRLESHLRSGVMSPGFTTNCHSGSRGLEVGLSSLSNTQLAEHYADCIKLSSENKINARNAFGLHLIDYMLEMLLERGELSNFQVAGCTLDAGAKIYASRVDSIYSDAYKVLGGIGRNEPLECDGSVCGKATSKTAKKEPSIATVEVTPKVLNVTNVDLYLEVDPFFKRMSTLFDEGGDEGLMLSQLPSRDDFSLVFDVECDDTEVGPVSSEHFELSTEGLITDEVDSYEICLPFSTFTFMENHSMDDFVSREEPILCDSGAEYLHLQQEYSMVPYPSSPAGSDCDDGFIMAGTEGIELSSCVHTEVAPDTLEPVDTTVMGVCGDGKLAHLDKLKCSQSGIQHSSGGDLVLTSALHQSEYSYFDPSTISTWAGLQHWKLKSNHTKESSDDKLNTRSSKQNKYSLKISFCDIPPEKLFQKSKALVSPSRSPLKKCTTLPHDVLLKMKSLLALFIRPQWKVLRQKRRIMMEDELDETWYDYEHSNGGVQDCLTSLQIQDDCEEHYDSDCMMEVSDTSHYRSLEVGEIDTTQLELVPQPKKVQKVLIDYAKNSKKIDARKIKETMWEILNNEKTENGNLQCGKNFSNICLQVSEHLSKTILQDVSVAICFVFLLHLANEKGLTLSGKPTLCDLHIDTQ